MGFLRARKAETNFERKWANQTFKPAAENLTAQGQQGLTNYLAALSGQDGGAGFNRFRQSTGYQNIFDEAMRGVTASAASRGMLSSNAALRARQDRAAQLAQQSFENYLASILRGSQIGIEGGQQAGRTVLAANPIEYRGGLSQLLGSVGGLASGFGSLFGKSGG